MSKDIQAVDSVSSGSSAGSALKSRNAGKRTAHPAADPAGGASSVEETGKKESSGAPDPVDSVNFSDELRKERLHWGRGSKAPALKEPGSPDAAADRPAEPAVGGKVPERGEETEDLAAEEKALTSLDRYFDVYDNPGGGGTDGKVSRDDLGDIASGEFNHDAARLRLEEAGVPADQVDKTLEEMKQGASCLLGHNELRDSLDRANDSGGKADGIISRSDLISVLFNRMLDQAEKGSLPPGAQAANQDSYNEVDTRNSERTPGCIAREEQRILESISGDGSPVSFTNANGRTEELSIKQMSHTSGNTVFELKGANGHTIRIESDLGARDSLTGLGRIVDYYTQIPPGLRDTVNTLSLQKGPDREAAARFFSSSDRIEFYDGLNNLNEQVFNHEYGHGIGYEKDGLGEGVVDRLAGIFRDRSGTGTPEGWSDSAAPDGNRVSDYAGKNIKEDFAESWAACLEAWENGPEARERFREAYPGRYALLEKLYNEGNAP